MRKSHFNELSLVLLGPIISRFLHVQMRKKNKLKKQSVHALVLSLRFSNISVKINWSGVYTSVTKCSCRLQLRFQQIGKFPLKFWSLCVHFHNCNSYASLMICLVSKSFFQPNFGQVKLFKYIKLNIFKKLHHFGSMK